MFYAVRSPDPTRALSPRQLPTDHDPAVPTREYQSDQSSRMPWLSSACCPNGVRQKGTPRWLAKQSQRGTKPTVFFPFGIPILPSTRLKAHQQERVPAKPPVEARSMPERCSPSRVRFAAPNSGAPLTAPRRSGQTLIATGGSGGNTSRSAPKKNAGFPPAAESRPEKKIPSNLEGLDRSLHIRTGTALKSSNNLPILR